MPKPYVREDRVLHVWIAFPSDYLRRAYVLASTAILVDGVHPLAERTNRLRLLIRALGGEQTAVEPKE